MSLAGSLYPIPRYERLSVNTDSRKLYVARSQIAQLHTVFIQRRFAILTNDRYRVLRL